MALLECVVTAEQCLFYYHPHAGHAVLHSGVGRILNRLLVAHAGGLPIHSDDLNESRFRVERNSTSTTILKLPTVFCTQGWM